MAALPASLAFVPSRFPSICYAKVLGNARPFWNPNFSTHVDTQTTKEDLHELGPC